MEVSMQLVLSVLTTAIAGVVGWFFHKLKKHEEKRELVEKQRLDEIHVREKAITDALRALCHDRILQIYKGYKSSGTISTTDLETATSLYNAYHALGGNGTLTALYSVMKNSLNYRGGDYLE